MSSRASRTLYVGNLPGDIREREVEDLFYKYGPIAHIDLKIPPRPPGYAFIEFEEARDAEDAIRGRDGYDFDGHRLRVELAHGGRGRSSSDRHSSYSSGRGRGVSRRSEYRVLVTGLPSSASWQDLKDHMRRAGDVCFSQVFRDGSGKIFRDMLVLYFPLCFSIYGDCFAGTTGIVDYTNYDDMKHAIKKLNDSEFRNAFSRSYVRVREYDSRRDHSQSPSRGRSYSKDRSASHSRSRSRGRSYSRSRSRSRSKSPKAKSSRRSPARSRSRSISSRSRSGSKPRSLSRYAYCYLSFMSDGHFGVDGAIEKENPVSNYLQFVSLLYESWLFFLLVLDNGYMLRNGDWILGLDGIWFNCLQSFGCGDWEQRREWIAIIELDFSELSATGIWKSPSGEACPSAMGVLKMQYNSSQSRSRSPLPPVRMVFCDLWMLWMWEKFHFALVVILELFLTLRCVGILELRYRVAMVMIQDKALKLVRLGLVSYGRIYVDQKELLNFQEG
ncbi:hypothetical protein Patl1_01004 [Pistacia atlantica]|uniref:Uncharacterized protein n=1 Tax=Pistacia atlantica TaxID=434234 RepID=A0ACC1C4X6_9ROSI|nr:hypothetical protein Patl1_01004 [Pistacia atlantica]